MDNNNGILTRIVNCGIHETRFYGTPRTLQDLIESVSSRAVWVTVSCLQALAHFPFVIGERTLEDVVIVTPRNLGITKPFYDIMGEDVINAAEQKGLVCGPHDLAFRLCLESQSSFPVLGTGLNIFTQPLQNDPEGLRIHFDLGQDQSIMRGPRDYLRGGTAIKPYHAVGDRGHYAFVRRK